MMKELTEKERFFAKNVIEVSLYTGYKEHDDFQKGSGYGFRFGGIYNTDDGYGFGKGYYSGSGNNNYPHELIQYWY